MECKKVLKVGKVVSCVDWLIEEGPFHGLPLDTNANNMQRYLLLDSMMLGELIVWDRDLALMTQITIQTCAPVFFLDLYAASTIGWTS